MSEDFVRGDLIYEGKAKRIYSVKNDPLLVWMEFKDSLTAFNALKKGEFSGKGQINRDIASMIFRFLQKNKIASHWVADCEQTSMLALRLQMIPLEVVVRNVVAGSLSKKFGLKEGEPLKSPLVELYYKNDELQDPFISDEQALIFGMAKDEKQLLSLKTQSLRINQCLLELFSAVDIRLVDFKLEFGSNSIGDILLADEITPDSCRLWDISTGEKMDKDRFRRDLGEIDVKYKEVLQRLKNKWGSSL